MSQENGEVDERKLSLAEAERRYADFRRGLPYDRRVVCERIQYILNSCFPHGKVFFRHLALGPDRYRGQWSLGELGQYIALYEWWKDGRAEDTIILYAPNIPKADRFETFNQNHTVNRVQGDIEYLMLCSLSPLVCGESIWDEDQVNKLRDRWASWLAGMDKITKLEKDYRDDIKADVAYIEGLIEKLRDRNKAQYTKYINILNASKRGLD